MAWKETYTVKGERRYRVRYRDDSGKKLSKTFDRSKDADAFKLETTRREQLGHLWQDKPICFGEFAGLHVDGANTVRLSGTGWFERYRPTVRDSTFDRRTDVLKHMRELLPVRLDKLTAGIVQDAILTVQKDHPRQAQILHDTLKMVLRNAVMRGQLVPPATLTLVRPADGPRRSPRALSHDEIELLAGCSSEPHLIRTAAYSGLRQGELFALRDEDIDLEAATITVCATVYDGRRFEHTKTDAGLRTIHVPPQAVTELKKQLLKRKQASTLVFPTARGNYHRPQHFDPMFKKAGEDAGLGDLVFHDLRHSYASLMVQTGVHPKVLQETLGHRNFNITMTLYSHLADGQRKDAAAGLGELLASKSGSSAASNN